MITICQGGNQHVQKNENNDIAHSGTGRNRLMRQHSGVFLIGFLYLAADHGNGCIPLFPEKVCCQEGKSFEKCIGAVIFCMIFRRHSDTESVDNGQVKRHCNGYSPRQAFSLCFGKSRQVAEANLEGTFFYKRIL